MNEGLDASAPVNKKVRILGSKSLSHRAAIAAASLSPPCFFVPRMQKKMLRSR